MKKTRTIFGWLFAYCVAALVWWAWAQLFGLSSTTKAARDAFAAMHAMLGVVAGFAYAITFNEHI